MELTFWSISLFDYFSNIKNNQSSNLLIYIFVLGYSSDMSATSSNLNLIVKKSCSIAVDAIF